MENTNRQSKQSNWTDNSNKQSEKTIQTDNLITQPKQLTKTNSLYKETWQPRIQTDSTDDLNKQSHETQTDK